MAAGIKLSLMNLLLLLLLCCFLNVKSQQFPIKKFTRIGLRSPVENVVVMEISRPLEVELEKVKDIEKKDQSGCHCVGYNCGCCEKFDIPSLELNETGCVNISYLPAPQYGLSVTLTVNNYTLFNRTISAQNPPAMCVDVPYFKKFASLCVKFSNLTLSKTQFSGCISVIAKLKFVLVDKIDLGCFHIPFAQEDSVLHYWKRYSALFGRTKLYKLKNFELKP